MDSGDDCSDEGGDGNGDEDRGEFEADVSS